MAKDYVDIGHLNNKLIVKSVNPTTDSGGGATEGTPTGGGNSLTSGVLVVGETYILTNWITDDDFTNVGAASNTDGVEFTASGTTPTKWTNSSVVNKVITIWANVIPMTGNRALEFAQITNGKPYEIVINYPIGDFTIDETNILTFDSRILTVHSVVQIDESLKQYKIIAYEKV